MLWKKKLEGKTITFLMEYMNLLLGVKIHLNGLENHEIELLDKHIIVVITVVFFLQFHSNQPASMDVFLLFNYRIELKF